MNRVLTDFECFCNVSHIHVIHIHIINAHIHIQTRFPNDGDQNAKVSSHACYSSKLTFSIQISDHLHDFNRRFNYIQSNEQERTKGANASYFKGCVSITSPDVRSDRRGKNLETESEGIRICLDDVRERPLRELDLEPRQSFRITSSFWLAGLW